MAVSSTPGGASPRAPSPPAPSPPVPSPCVNVCAIDPKTRLCMGCYRTLEEIAAWPRLTAAERVTLRRELAERAERVGPFPLKGARRKK